ncbi:GNAT family N-acetyltransferase [Paracoccus sp. (in: a-proteobacteria)]|uniref:GNAT family N-acetyltransferase n=1 Tax=Paracoccus sp. TaxID=267 RepID=UPI0028A1A9F7|nr:GNAT family N-acetyltransferase [Paracoccus sp. (in: a-proteobacteria)]
MIRLELISHQDLDRVAHVAVLPEQEPFCGTIGEHFSNLDPDLDFHAILKDEQVVGFLKTDRAYHTRYDFAHPDEIGVRGVMVNADEQGKGTGKAAMLALRDHAARLYPAANGLILTVNIVNAAARAAYLAAGWRDEGELYHGGNISAQHILRLSLRDKT